MFRSIIDFWKGRDFLEEVFLVVGDDDVEIVGELLPEEDAHRRVLREHEQPGST